MSIQIFYFSVQCGNLCLGICPLCLDYHFLDVLAFWSLLFNFHMFVSFLKFLMWLISNFISLQLENTLYYFKYINVYFMIPQMGCQSEYAHVLEKTVSFAVVGRSVLQVSFGFNQLVMLCCPRFLSSWSFSAAFFPFLGVRYWSSQILLFNCLYLIHLLNILFNVS